MQFTYDRIFTIDCIKTDIHAALHWVLGSSEALE